MGKKGRRYEHEVANEISRGENSVLAWPAGYSGNNAVPSPDIVTVSDSGAAGWELKRTNQQTFGIDESELQQLLDLQHNFFDVGLVVKFANREPLLVEPAFPSLSSFGLDSPVSPIENFKTVIPTAFNPRETDGGSEPTLRVSKPSLEEWASAQAGQSAAGKIVGQH